MTGPTFSPDGKWMWNGSEWIPAPPQSDVLIQIEQSQENYTTPSLLNPNRDGELLHRFKTSALSLPLTNIV